MGWLSGAASIASSALRPIYKKAGEIKDTVLDGAKVIAPSVQVNPQIQNPNAPEAPAQNATSPISMPVTGSAIGAIAGQPATTPKPSYMTDPNAGHPTGNLASGSIAAAEKTGQSQQAAQSVAMAGASQNAGKPVPVDRTKLAYASDPNAAHQTSDLGAGASTAASVAGERQQSAQANVMRLASEAAAREAQIRGKAAEPQATFTPLAAPEATYNPAGDSKALAAGGSALDAILAQINDGKPSAAVQNAITGNREIMSKATQAAARQTAKAVTSSGGIGQGTQNQAIQDLGQSAVSALASSELGNQQLISDEAQKVRDQAIQVYENAKTREQQGTQFDANRKDNNSQFNVTAGQTQQTINNQASQFDRSASQQDTQIANQAAQFEKNLASADRATMTNALERMATDNPVLAAKLQKHLMSGGNGDIGAFTPDEQRQINEYVAKKEATQAKYDNVMQSILESIPSQIETGKATNTDAQVQIEKDRAIASAKEKLNTLGAGAFVAPADFETLSKSGDIPRATAESIPKGPDAVNEWLKANPTGIVNLDGQQYKVIKGTSPATGHGLTTMQMRHTDVVEVQNEKGETKYIYDGKVNDAYPKVVSQDFFPDFF